MTTTALPAVLDVAEVAAALRLAPWTVSKMCRQGRLPGAFKIGASRWRIPRSTVIALMQGNVAP